MVGGNPSGSAHWPHCHTDLRHSASPASRSLTFGPTWGIPYDLEVWGTLGGVPVPMPAPIPLVTITVDRPLLRLGSTGTAVFELQTALNLRGFTPGFIDGNFGATTQDAVRRFQASKGLLGDGIAGKLTLTALMDY